MDGVLIFGATVAFLIMAWSNMHIDTRRELAGWFWLMLVVGAVAATAWSWAYTGIVRIPLGPQYHDNWN